MDGEATAGTTTAGHDARRSDTAATPAAADALEERVPFSVIFGYSMPMAGLALVLTPFSMYWMKYCIEVLLVAPAALGTIRTVASVWDAISDPVVGNLSDRTNTRWGRRRPWIVAGAIPLAITYVLIWVPPAFLDGIWLIGWIALAYLLYETASTCVFVPYGALGMELSEGHHDRTRVFAWSRFIMALGSGGGLGALYLMLNAADKREMALILGVVAGVVISAGVLYSAWTVPERDNYQGRGNAPLLRAFSDVFRNPHATIFLAATTIEAFGMAIVPALVLFVLDDVLQDEGMIYRIIGIYMVFQFVLFPLWVRLAKVVGKKKLWLSGMCLSIVGFASTMFIDVGTYAVIYTSISFLAVGTGISMVIGPSVTADIIDVDELATGERKEGSYTAVMNFIRKLGLALSGGVAGWGLQISGYDATAEVQTETVRSAILWMTGGIPFICYVIGALLFSRFGLTGAEHARVQAELAVRRAGADLESGLDRPA